MSSPLFSIAVRDLENGPRIVRAPLPADFLRRLLEDTDVAPVENRESRVSLTVEKTDRQVLVRGSLDVTVSVPCSRTLDPAVYRLEPQVFLLLSQKNDGQRSHGMQRRQRPAPATPAKAPEKRASASKSRAAKGAWDDDPELGLEDAAEDSFSGDHVILDDFIREFILLEIPMVPLREDLRSQDFEASPPPPSPGPLGQGPANAGGNGAESDMPLDPRLSPLAELKARLEKKKE